MKRLYYWFNKTFFGWFAVLLSVFTILSLENDLASASLSGYKVAAELSDLTLWLMAGAGGAIGLCLCAEQGLWGKLTAWVLSFATAITFAPAGGSLLFKSVEGINRNEALMIACGALGGLAAPLWQVLSVGFPKLAQWFINRPSTIDRDKPNES